MPERAASEPITIRTAKVAEIDALAGAMDRSRNYIVNQAIEQYLEANAWQMERISDGIAAAREGKVAPADQVFSGIGVHPNKGTKHDIGFLAVHDRPNWLEAAKAAKT